jgi:cyclic pyranopterin phosphate synthase
MPKEVFGRDYAFLPRSEILSFEEMARAARCFAALGVEKIRLTGGEPLLRRGIESLVGQLAEIPGIQDLTLTTNGSLLTRMAGPLREAGLHRLTVSLDALDQETFARMNDVDFSVQRVVEGIEAAVAAGFAPVKINAVIRRGVNEHAIRELTARFGGPEYIVRFIEYMDVGSTNRWRLDEVVSAEEIEQQLRLQPLDANYAGEVAKRYRTPAGGEVGIITSVTRPFCRECSRARLTADGRLYTCLFGTHGHDLRTVLRGQDSDEAVKAFISSVWSRRQDRYSEIRSEAPDSVQGKIEMSRIGG